MEVITQSKFILSEDDVIKAVRYWLVNAQDISLVNQEVQAEFGHGGETYGCTITAAGKPDSQ